MGRNRAGFFSLHSTGWERKVHVTPSVDLYSGFLVFSMTLITVCVLSSV